ncbi:hypothetical protein [Paenibacillus polymyxa]|nr:hypothetical protein [Paenibacillus polymyxa]
MRSVQRYSAARAQLPHSGRPQPSFLSKENKVLDSENKVVDWQALH